MLQCAEVMRSGHVMQFDAKGGLLTSLQVKKVKNVQFGVFDPDLLVSGRPAAWALHCTVLPSPVGQL